MRAQCARGVAHQRNPAFGERRAQRVGDGLEERCPGCEHELRKRSGQSVERRALQVRLRLRGQLAGRHRGMMPPTVAAGQKRVDRRGVGFVAIPEPVETTPAGFEGAVQCGNQERHEQFAWRLEQGHVLGQFRDVGVAESAFLDHPAPRQVAGVRRDAAGKQHGAKSRGGAVGGDQQVGVNRCHVVVETDLDTFCVFGHACDGVPVVNRSRRQHAAQRPVDGVPR
jgi:hypothetical protein